MRKATMFIVLAFLLVLGAAPAYAQGIPKLPHAFYGSVTVNGSPAPNGTRVSATVNIGDIISTQNPVTTVGGSYGIGSSYLLVQGYDIPDGATITFHVTNPNGTAIGDETATFEAGGGPTQLNLTVTIAEEEDEGPAAPAALVLTTTLFGVQVSFSISSDGKILETITATSADGNLTITIPKGTIALDKDGEPLSRLTVKVNPNPPSPPEDASIIGLAYDFGPAGATFDPPITLEYTYDPADIPEGVAEEELVVAYHDEDAGEWKECECTCDPETHCVTASVSHFTTFAIIAYGIPAALPLPAAFSLSNLTVQPAEVQPRETVTITVIVANTGGTEGSYTVVLKLKGVKEAEKSVIIAAGSSEIVTFSVTKEEPGSYTVAVDGLSASFTVITPPAPPAPPPPPPAPAPVTVPTEPPMNWPLIGGIVAAVIVVALLIIFLLVRRRAS